jgi:hypothetical protein
MNQYFALKNFPDRRQTKLRRALRSRLSPFSHEGSQKVATVMSQYSTMPYWKDGRC